MDSSSLTFLMHRNVRKHAADRFGMHFWRYVMLGKLGNIT